MNEKAIQLINKIKVHRLEDGTWKVDGTTDTYTINWFGLGGNCTCKGYKYRGWCSHLEAVRMLAPNNSEEELILDELL